jgi:hypothetical protein
MYQGRKRLNQSIFIGLRLHRSKSWLIQSNFGKVGKLRAFRNKLEWVNSGQLSKFCSEFALVAFPMPFAPCSLFTSITPSCPLQEILSTTLLNSTVMSWKILVICSRLLKLTLRGVTSKILQKPAGRFQNSFFGIIWQELVLFVLAWLQTGLQFFLVLPVCHMLNCNCKAIFIIGFEHPLQASFSP